MDRFVITPEVAEIGRRIYEWDRDAIYGYGSRTREDYTLINSRGWIMADGSSVRLSEPELSLAIDIARKRRLEDVD